MCMQSSERAATHSQDQSDRLLQVILTFFFVAEVFVAWLVRQSLWSDMVSRHAAPWILREIGAFYTPFEMLLFFLFFTSPMQLCLGHNGNFLTSFTVSPDRILQLLRYVLKAQTIRQEPDCFHSHFVLKSSFSQKNPEWSQSNVIKIVQGISTPQSHLPVIT